MDSKIIEFNKVNYQYQNNTPLASKALHNLSFKIKKNDYVAIVGHTGSGKSTMIQILNGLLLPTSGTVKVLNYTIDNQIKNEDLYQLRKHIGIVFQFAESQLFAETVLEDVSFAPINFGLSKDEANTKAIRALEQVGISEDIYLKSPFELSGGQKRRVAIAGVIAMDPQILILDEPTIGLDPKGRVEIMELIEKLHKKGTTIILVTHSMDDVFQYATDVIALDKGKLVKQANKYDFFSDEEWLFKHHLKLPKIIEFTNKLKKLNLISKDISDPSIKLLAKEIAASIQGGHMS